MTDLEKRNALLTALSTLEAANKSLAAARRALEIAEMRAGQKGPALLFAGIAIDVFRKDRDTGYVPKIAPGRAVLHEELVRAIKETILRRSSAVDSAYRAYIKAAADVAEASK